MILKRITAKGNPHIPVMGVLLFDEMPFAVTLERSWMDNKRNVSCIPDGIYACERVKSQKFGDTFEVKSVKGRSHILFHKGNIDEDTHGCVILGESFGLLNDEPAVMGSGVAFKEFMDILKKEDSFPLAIEWV